MASERRGKSGPDRVWWSRDKILFTRSPISFESEGNCVSYDSKNTSDVDPRFFYHSAMTVKADIWVHNSSC